MTSDHITSGTRQANFNPIARPYRYLEYLALGPILQRTRTHYLAHLLDRRQAVVLGDGDGRFLADLLAANSTLNAVAVDTSGAMLDLLLHRCKLHRSRLQIVNANALSLRPLPETDLIVTHFFLDCLTQPEADFLIPNLTRHLRPGTLWLISDFRVPQGLMRFPARLYIRALYLAFRIITGLQTTHLPNHQTPLEQAGFTQIHQHFTLFGLLTTELWIKQNT